MERLKRRKKKEVRSKDGIFEDKSRENNSIPPTQKATQVEEEPIVVTTIEEIIPRPKSSSPPPKHDVDHNRRKEREIGSKERKKRKRDKEGKSSVTAPPSASEKPPGDDDANEEPLQGERQFQDEIFEGADGKNGTIHTTSTEHAAQVEGKQSADNREELVNPSVQSPSPSRCDVHDLSEIFRAKTETFSSRSPRKEQEAGSGKIKKRRVGATEDKEERSAGLVGSRVFTEEDEITVLKGMIDCGLLRNVPALSLSIGVLYEFLEGKLHSDFNKTQIYEKIRRLKQKFAKNMDWYKRTGNPPLKPHEAMVFELSKKIWGGNGVDSPNSNKHTKNLSVVGNGTDVNRKKKSSRGGKDVAGKLQILAGAVVGATLNDGGTRDGGRLDDGGVVKVKTGNHDAEVKDEEDHKNFMTNILLGKFGNVIKKCRLRLELAKLELDELKKKG